MSNQQQPQLEEVQKKRRSRKQQESNEVIDITAIKGTAEAEVLQRMSDALIHEQKRRQTDTRYFKRVRATDHMVQEIGNSFLQQFELWKTGKKPKMWTIVKDMLEALKITSKEVGVSAAEVAKAIKNVFGPIDPNIESKPLDKIKASVRSIFITCTRHGFEIHSVKIDGVERYFLHRKKEDFDAYDERLKQRLDDGFQSLDSFEERRDRILKEQNEKEKERLMVGADGETMVEAESATEPVETEQTEVNTEDKNQANEGNDE
jgi:hypothetical protein